MYKTFRLFYACSGFCGYGSGTEKLEFCEFAPKSSFFYNTSSRS